MTRDLIVFATADWAEQYWTNKQRMADQFSQCGFRVLYVESFGLRTPGKNKKDCKRLFRRLLTGLRPAKKIKNNLWVLSPLVIPRWQNKYVAKCNYLLLRIQLTFFKLCHRFQQALVWSYHPYVTPLLSLFQTSKLYYHVVDNIVAVPTVDIAAYRAAETQFLTQVAAVFVTSVPLKTYYESITPAPVYYSPNVVDVAHFTQARTASPPADLQCIPHPRLLYYGVLSDFKIDLELLYAVATQHSNWQLILIGSEREGQNATVLKSLKKLPNVHCLGYRPYAQLPQYLSGIDVGILPLLDNLYTRYMFPMKFFEFLAAGIPVVSKNIDALLPYQDLFLAASNVDEFIEAIEDSLREKKSVITIDELEKQYSWQARMQQVLNVI